MAVGKLRGGGKSRINKNQGVDARTKVSRLSLNDESRESGTLLVIVIQEAAIMSR